MNSSLSSGLPELIIALVAMGFLKPIIENQNSRLSRTSNEKAEGTYNYKNTENIFRWKGLVISVLENGVKNAENCKLLDTMSSTFL